ncbi:Crp/Fnr family transcriptional regulator [Alkalispirillum mobile]|uniref:Crp/Fnr family transcriptional regulator n=2 Tax=Alkalispirillum mobile TaxID=85925 RepID=A0A498BTL5_9GAMM|nr:Crp/Fnr family transcriptional regulator [Alkalispirillum mobile]
MIMNASMAGQNPDCIEQLLAQSERHLYAPRATIMMAGEASETLYYLNSGSITVFMDECSSREVIIDYLYAGSFFGALSLFRPGAPRGAWVRARGACEVAEIPYSRFRQLAGEHPELMEMLASQLADRLRRAQQKIHDLACLDVAGRIMSALRDLAARPEAMTHPDGMQVRITRQELGRIVGCSREMVGRVLKTLDEEDQLAVQGKNIVVFERPDERSV